MTKIQEKIIQDKQLKVLATSLPTKRQNTENILATDNVFDYLVTHTGDIGVFDIRKSVRKTIENYFKQGLKFIYHANDTSGFSLRGKTGYICSLTQIIAAKKYNKRLATIQKSRVYCLDGSILNLVDSNIEWCRASVDDENMHNTFEISGDQFVITNKKDGLQFFANADNGLIEILKSLRWYVTRQHLRTYYHLLKYHFDIGHIVYCYYNYGMTPTTMQSSLKKMLKEIGKKLSIDHFDSNPCNNTHRNLSLMTKPTNTKKHKITARIKSPWIFHGIYVDGNWRVGMGYIENISKDKLGLHLSFHIFNDEKHLLYTLQMFYKHGCFIDVDGKQKIMEYDGCSPKKYHRRLSAEHKAFEFPLDIKKQFDDLLLNKTEDEFIQYRLYDKYTIKDEYEVGNEKLLIWEKSI